jgi:hypothetical protein
MHVSTAPYDPATSLPSDESFVRRSWPYAMVGLGVLATVAWTGFLTYLVFTFTVSLIHFLARPFIDMA